MVPKTTIYTPTTYHFCLACTSVGNIPKYFPKMIVPSILSTKPTLSVTRGPIPTIGDHGGPHQSPKTTIYTPKTYHFCLACTSVGNIPKYFPKMIVPSILSTKPTLYMLNKSGKFWG